MPSSMEEALGKAGTSLEQALNDVRVDDGKTTEEDAQLSENNPVVADDPDDLAAAFFAQQALLKEKETKLDVEDWALSISKSLQQKNEHQIEKEWSSSATQQWVKERREILKQAVVDHLVKEYNIVLGEQEASL